MKHDPSDFAERRNTARDAKAALLAKAKARMSDPTLEAKRAERAAVTAARAEREAVRRAEAAEMARLEAEEAQRRIEEAKRQAAEEARLAAEREAAAEAERQARLAASSPRHNRMARLLADEAALKAARKGGRK